MPAVAVYLPFIFQIITSPPSPPSIPATLLFLGDEVAIVPYMPDAICGDHGELHRLNDLIMDMITIALPQLFCRFTRCIL